MIQVYLDWNVFVKMKNGYNNELLEILSNKEKFFIPFSTSHISDIMPSYSEDEQQLKNIDSDLEFITKTTNNWCLSIYKKELNLYQSDPKSIFKQYVEDKDYMKGFSLDTIAETFNDNELTKGIGKTFVDLLNEMPLDKAMIDAFDNPEASEFMNKLFPGLKENPTMGGFFKAFGKMYENFNENEDYRFIRDYAQKGLGINPNRLTNSKNPMEMINTIFNELGVDINQFIPKPVVGPDWYNNLNNEYLKLDMYGYHQDKIQVKPNKRKETFKNTTEDAFHAGFASTCNYYITNDNKTYHKTKELYKNTGIQTQVYKDFEFIEHYNKLLSCDDIKEHLNNTINLIKHSVEEYRTKEVKQKVANIYQTFLFDVFNKVEVMENKNKTLTIIRLSKAYPSNTVLYIELEILVKQLHHLFGDDLNNKALLQKSEFDTTLWVGRQWKFNEFEFDLKCESDNIFLTII